MPRKKEWVVEVSSEKCPYCNKYRNGIGGGVYCGKIESATKCTFKNCPISVEKLKKKRMVN